jgi:hypothetical protein
METAKASIARPSAKRKLVRKDICCSIFVLYRVFGDARFFGIIEPLALKGVWNMLDSSYNALRIFTMHIKTSAIYLKNDQDNLKVIVIYLQCLKDPGTQLQI